MTTKSNGSGPDPNIALSKLCRLLATHVAEIDQTLQNSGEHSSEALTDALAGLRRFAPRDGQGAELDQKQTAELIDHIEDQLLDVGKILQMHDIMRQYHELVQEGIDALADHLSGETGTTAEDLETTLWDLCHSKAQRSVHRTHFPDRSAEEEKPKIQLF
ncbi:MAG: hypothetical protein AAF713_11965 [Pseudomonadota bacterium]